MTGKIITLWGAESKAGCRTIAQALGDELLSSGLNVLRVEIDSSFKNSSKDPAEWIPRFKTLSPLLLRNYLNTGKSDCAQLSLSRIPEKTITRELMPLLRSAFDWVIWSSDVDWTPESLLILDQSHLLLWVARHTEQSKMNLQNHFSKLAELHYPNSFSKILLNRVPATFREFKLLDDGKSVLAHVPEETPPGLLINKAISRCVVLLLTRDELFRTVAETSEALSIDSQSVVDSIKNRIKPQLVEVMGQGRTASTTVAAQQTLNQALAEDTSLNGSREVREEIYKRVLDDVLGLGPLEPLLKDAQVSEIMVNGRGSIFVEKKGKLHLTDVQFPSDTQLRTVIDRIVAPIGRRVDESMPLCDARLADGSRVNIVLPPLALDGAVMTIRKFMAKSMSLAELSELGSLNKEMVCFLRACVLLRKNIIVSGGTGSGKTTLLNALSGLIPDDERIVTIEDAAELRLQKPHVVRLESRPENAEGQGSIPIRRLVINALRMRPDRIVVGECRGGEALDMLQAMNTGHDGSLTTLHANTPRDALRRLETLVLMAGMDLPIRVVRDQIQSAVDIVIQQSRQSDGSRKITSIAEVSGMEGDVITIQELFKFRGTHQSTGLTPTFAEELRALSQGISL
jgi:pilus assembly protein CpaF